MAVDSNKIKASLVAKNLEDDIKFVNQARTNNDFKDVDFDHYVVTKYKSEGITSFSRYLNDMGIDTSRETFNDLTNRVADYDVRWIIPEIWRTAIKAGLRRAPIYPQLISREIDVKNNILRMPYWNMSDAEPRKLNEGESIKMGTLSYGSTEMTISKMGRGITVTYETSRNVPIDLTVPFFEDFGIKMGYVLDAMAIDVAVNGNTNSGGTDSAPVIGVSNTTTGITYRDLLRVWARGSRLGINLSTTIANEEVAIDLMDLMEFKTRVVGTPIVNLNIKSPVPTSADVYVHSLIPDSQLLLVDKQRSLVKLNNTPLLIESEKDITNQTLVYVASITTGFAKVFKDSAVLLDGTVNVSANPIPDYMDPTSSEQATLKH